MGDRLFRTSTLLLAITWNTGSPRPTAPTLWILREEYWIHHRHVEKRSGRGKGKFRPAALFRILIERSGRTTADTPAFFI